MDHIINFITENFWLIWLLLILTFRNDRRNLLSLVVALLTIQIVWGMQPKLFVILISIYILIDLGMKVDTSKYNNDKPKEPQAIESTRKDPDEI